MAIMFLFGASLWAQVYLDEGFEDGFIPENWTVLNEDGGSKEWEASTSNPHTGDYCARVQYESSSLDNDDWLITPPLQVSSATADTIKFWMRTYSTNDDPWEVLVSTTDTNPSSFTMIDSGIGGLPDYVQKEYSLDSYGDAIVYVAVRYIGSYDWYLYVDDFEGPPIVVPPYDVTITNLSGEQSVEIGTTATYEIEIENVGDENDTYDLSIVGEDWNYTYPATISVNAAESAIIDLEVTVPSDATMGDTDEITFTATSQGDNSVSDTVEITTTAISGAVTTFPWDEGFENEWPPLGWTVVNGEPGSYWEQSSVSSNTGDNSARSYQGSGSSYVADEWLITPALDLDEAEALMLTFFGYSNQTPDGTREKMRIMIMDEVYDNVTDLHANSTELDVKYFTGDWEEYSVNLATYSGEKHIAFNYYITEGDDASFNWIYVDDVLAYELPDYDFEIANLTGDLAIQAGETGTYEVEIENKGTENDTYDLTITGDTWTYTYPATVTVNTGETAIVDVDVDVPADAGMGDTDEIELTVTSQGENTISHDLTITTTAVALIATPYFEDFDDVSTPELPIGWAKIVEHPSSTSPKVETYSSGSPHSPPNHVRLYSNDEEDADILLITPPVADLDESRIRFWAKCSSSTNIPDLIIGTITDPMDEDTFTPFYTIEADTELTSDYQEFIVNFDTYVGTDQYIAFKHGVTPSFFRSIYIDDFNYEEVPAGPVLEITPMAHSFGELVAGEVSDPVDFELSNVGTGTLTLESGDIDITGDDSADFILGSITYPISLEANESETIIVEFAPQTAGEKTATLEINYDELHEIALSGYAFPEGTLVEGFEGDEFPPPYWTYVDGDLGSYWEQSSVNSYTGEYSARSYAGYSSSYNADEWLITPEVDIAAGDSLIFYGLSSNAPDGERERLFIKVLDDPNNVDSAVLVDSLFLSDEWGRYSLSLEDHLGENHIAFHYYQDDASFNYIYIDDVVGPQLVEITEPMIAISPENFDVYLDQDDIITETLTISNDGGSDLTFDLTITDNGTRLRSTRVPWLSVDPVSGIVEPDESVDVDVTFDATGLAGGLYEADIEIEHNAGDDDIIVPVTMDVFELITVDLPYMADFDTGVPTGWQIIAGGDTDDTWEWIEDLNGNTLDGTPFMIVDSDAAGSGSILLEETLITPAFDASDIDDSLMLEFDQYYRHLGNQYSEVDVWDGTDWVNVLYQDVTVGSWTDPDHQVIDITAYANDELRIRFYFTDGTSYGWYWAIDNVNVYEDDVVGEPEIAVSPLSFYVQLNEDEMTTEVMNIANDGTAELAFNITLDGDPDIIDRVTRVSAGDDVLYDRNSARRNPIRVDWLSVDPATGTVAAGDDLDIDVTFDADGLALGTYTADIVIDHNAGEDVVVPATLDVIEDIPLPIYLDEDFTGIATGDIPVGWTTTHTNWGANDSNNAGGQAPEMRFNWSPSATDVFRLSTHALDVSDAGVLDLTFKHMVNNFSGPGIYTLKVEASTDGVTWNEEWAIVDPDDIPAETVSVDFSDYAGEEELYVAWVFDGDSYDINQWYIDDIFLYEPLPTPNPAALVHPEDGATDVVVPLSLQWEAGIGAAPTGYELYFGDTAPPPFVADLGDVTSYLMDDLDYNTTYYWKIIPYNDEGSAIGSPIWSFTTGPDPHMVAPYLQGFDAVSTPDLPYGWSKIEYNPDMAAYVETSTTGSPVSPPNHVRIRSNDHPDQDVMLITPPIDGDLSEHRIRFWAKCNLSTNIPDLLVGTMSDPGDPDSFTLFETIAADTQLTDDYQQFTVSFEDYVGDDNFIAFKHGITPDWTRDIRVDDFEFLEITDQPIVAVTPEEITFPAIQAGEISDPIDVTITNVGGGLLVLDTGDIEIVGANPDDFTLGAITYPIELAMDESEDITVQFSPLTDGNKVATLEIAHGDDVAEVTLMGYAYPEGTLIEGFEEPWVGTPEAPEDWAVVNGEDGSYWEQSSVASHTGDYAARSYQGVSSDYVSDEWMITPALDLDAVDDPVLAFYGYSSQTPDGTKEKMRILVMDEVYDNVADLHANAVLVDSLYFTSDWDSYLVNLDDHSGVKYLAFNYWIRDDEDASFNWIYVDDVIGPPMWLPDDGTIEGTVDLVGGDGDVTDVTVTAGEEVTNPDATGFYSIDIQPGTYDVTASLIGYETQTIENVEVLEGLVTPDIDFTLNNVDIAVSPASFDVELETGQTEEHTLTITNDGGGDLYYDISLIDTSDLFEAGTTSGSLFNPTHTRARNERNARFDERAPMTSEQSNIPQATDDMFDLLDHFPVGVGGGEYSVATNGNYIYTAAWNSTEFYRYDMEGNYIETFSVAGAGNLRDMTFDGEYFYGSDNSSTIYEMDLDNENLVSSFTTTGSSSIRGIAYDPDEDGFWVTNGWDPPLTLVDRSGSVIETLTSTTSSISGLAWENVTEDGPHIWAYTQSAGTNQNSLEQIDMDTGAVLQVFDATTTGVFAGDAISGGIMITDQLVSGKWTFLGTSQNDIIWVIELGDSGPPWLAANPLSGVVPAGESEDIDVVFDATDILAGTFTADISIASNAQEDPVIVPATLTVETFDPVITYEPDEFDVTMDPDEIHVEELTIGNIGGADLTFSIEAEEDTREALSDRISIEYSANSNSRNTRNPRVDWLSFDPDAGTVEPQDEVIVDVTFDSDGLDTGVYTANIVIEHNAGEDVVIPVSLTIVGTEILPYFADFNDGLPMGWEIIQGGDTDDTWHWTTDYNGNTLDGTPFMFVDSDAAGSGSILVEETMITPPIDASDVDDALMLEFDQYYRHLGSQYAEVDVWDGSQWVNLLHQDATIGDWNDPDTQVIDISDYANDELKVRFYFNDGTSWAWYWAVDNVHIYEDYIGEPEIAVDPDEFEVDLAVGETTTETMTITNDGDAVLEYNISIVEDGYTATEYGRRNVDAPLSSIQVIEHHKYDTPRGFQAHDSTRDPIEIHYDTGYDENGVGTDGVATWFSAVRFTSEELSTYYGEYQITGIKYHIRDSQFTNVTVRIWEGGSMGDPGTEVYSHDVTDAIVIDEWSTHMLTTPVPLLPGNEYWIGYSIDATGDHPSSVDAGPMVDGKGGWIALAGGDWEQLSEYALDYNWCIRGLIDEFQEPWLSLSQYSGTVNPGESVDIDVNFNATEVEPGETYTADIVINNNTADDPVIVPATMNVEDMVLDPPTNLVVDSDTALFEWEAPAVIANILSSAEPSLGDVRSIRTESRQELVEYDVYLDGTYKGTTEETQFQFDTDELVTDESYVAGVVAVYDVGESDMATVEFTYTGVSADDPIIAATELGRNYPNPFNPATTIAFSLKEAGQVTINVYDIRGSLVRTLVDSYLDAAHHTVVWDGMDNRGRNVSSGVYFYRMVTEEYTETRKMIMMK
jgi:uncharacterized membrane protein